MESLSSDQLEQLLNDVISTTLSGGNFKETSTTPDGRKITFHFSWATGMGWNSTKSSYLSQFKTIPSWLFVLHPSHRVQLCRSSMNYGKGLPVEISDYQFKSFLSKYSFTRTSESLEGEINMKISANETDLSSITEFEVDDDGVLSIAKFIEPENRAGYYEYVASFWSSSPEYLAEAMDECQPLAWAVYEIYTSCRSEIDSELASTSAMHGEKTHRFTALKQRLNSMPAESEHGAKNWLLSLTNNEFENLVVPEIEIWFSNSPNWNFEDDYLPKTGTAHGSALEFFRQMSSDELDALDISIVEGDRPGSSYEAAELSGDVANANRVALARKIHVRFTRAIK